MKNLLAAFCLTALSIGALSMPARADLNIELGRYNHNSDRWNYRQFHNADRNYYRHHRDVEIINSRDAFNRFGPDNDGYVNTEVIRGYRTW